jgi:hypothetical protein
VIFVGWAGYFDLPAVLWGDGFDLNSHKWLALAGRP